MILVGVVGSFLGTMTALFAYGATYPKSKVVYCYR